MEINQRSYSDDAYIIIREKIIKEYAFGQRLHHVNIAKELGVSQTPIREALLRLTQEGLAESKAHKGMFVVSPTRDDVIHLCDARYCLESYMAESVINNATDKDLAELRKCVQRDPSTPLFSGFHDAYAEIADNQVLRYLHTRVHSILKVLFYRAAKVADPALIDDHYEGETAILTAIENRDLDQLINAIKEHIREFQDYILEANVIDNPQSVDIDAV